MSTGVTATEDDEDASGSKPHGQPSSAIPGKRVAVEWCPTDGIGLSRRLSVLLALDVREWPTVVSRWAEDS
jgi:hypothetical protein